MTHLIALSKSRASRLAENVWKSFVASSRAHIISVHCPRTREYRFPRFSSSFSSRLMTAVSFLSQIVFSVRDVIVAGSARQGIFGFSSFSTACLISSPCPYVHPTYSVISLFVAVKISAWRASEQPQMCPLGPSHFPSNFGVFSSSFLNPWHVFDSP